MLHWEETIKFQTISHEQQPPNIFKSTLFGVENETFSIIDFLTPENLADERFGYGKTIKIINAIQTEVI